MANSIKIANSQYYVNLKIINNHVEKSVKNYFLYQYFLWQQT